MPESPLNGSVKCPDSEIAFGRDPLPDGLAVSGGDGQVDLQPVVALPDVPVPRRPEQRIALLHEKAVARVLDVAGRADEDGDRLAVAQREQPLRRAVALLLSGVARAEQVARRVGRGGARPLAGLAPGLERGLGRGGAGTRGARQADQGEAQHQHTEEHREAPLRFRLSAAWRS